VGTNNQDLLNDPLYLGINKTRLTGEKYNELMDEFVEGVQDRWPGALIQFEDFTNDHAFYLLEKYRHQMLCFNDDIQGTGAVALAGLLGALRIAGGKLEDQKIVFLGAGTAAVGIANMIVAGIVEESGIRPEEARKQLWFLDSKGLITTRRGDTLKAHKIPYARDMEFIPTLTEVIRKVKPTVLMGLSGQANSFTETVIKEMARHVKRPIIFALSNPTSKAECTARQAYTWTDGKAVFASGSPFEPVEHKGQMYVPGQGNNMFIFPGVGLGLVACGAKKVTDSMFYTAARTLAKRVTDTDLHQGTVYPGLKRIRQITESIATAVCRVAYKEGLATVPVPDDILTYIQNQMYHPAYAVYESDS
jgi:malate dehydrogenase (oxaloacetate-decarboxylating)(NADP+)